MQGLSTSLNCDLTQANLLIEVQDRETAQVVRRLATQVPHFWHKTTKTDRGDSGRAPTKNTRSGEKFPLDRHQSLQRSSLASSQVHLEECSPPYRRVHKVRKEQVQAESEYPLRYSVVWAPVESWDRLIKLANPTPPQHPNSFL